MEFPIEHKLKKFVIAYIVLNLILSCASGTEDTLQNIRWYSLDEGLHVANTTLGGAIAVERGFHFTSQIPKCSMIFFNFLLIAFMSDQCPFPI